MKLLVILFTQNFVRSNGTLQNTTNGSRIYVCMYISVCIFVSKVKQKCGFLGNRGGESFLSPIMHNFCFYFTFLESSVRSFSTMSAWQKLVVVFVSSLVALMVYFKLSASQREPAHQSRFLLLVLLLHKHIYEYIHIYVFTIFSVSAALKICVWPSVRCLVALSKFSIIRHWIIYEFIYVCAICMYVCISSVLRRRVCCRTTFAFTYVRTLFRHKWCHPKQLSKYVLIKT